MLGIEGNQMSYLAIAVDTAMSAWVLEAVAHDTRIWPATAVCCLVVGWLQRQLS